MSNMSIHLQITPPVTGLWLVVILPRGEWIFITLAYDVVGMQKVAGHYKVCNSFNLNILPQ